MIRRFSIIARWPKMVVVFTFSLTFGTVVLLLGYRYAPSFDNYLAGNDRSKPFHDSINLIMTYNHVSSNIIYTNILALWSSPLGSVPYKPRLTGSPVGVLHALLLLSAGDMEVNPGPAAPRLMNMSSRTLIIFGIFNCRSAVNKAASLHTLISDFGLDVIALSETWMAADAPLAILNDVASAGYSVLHVHRLATPGGSARGGGLAVVHRNTVPVRVHPLRPSHRHLHTNGR